MCDLKCYWGYFLWFWFMMSTFMCNDICSSTKSFTDTQGLNFNNACAYCSVLYAHAQYYVCLGLHVRLSVCAAVRACKVSASLCRALSCVCVCMCVRPCSQRWRQRPAPLWVMVGRAGQSAGLSQIPLFSSGPANGFFVWGTQHERPASFCLLICWSAQATVTLCCSPFSLH